VVRISIRCECKNIRLSTTSGRPARSAVGIELNHNVPLTFGHYDIQLLVPAEFATLLEVGLPVTVTLDPSEK
jgi:hypothetical protein